jgi:hypothetical protein
MKPQRTALTNITSKSLHDWLINHSRVLAGNIEFGDTMTNKEPGRNIKCSKATGATPGAANTEFAVTHTLGKVPITFFHHTDNGGVIYKSTTAWTKTQIFLKCTTATANYSMVII